MSTYDELSQESRGRIVANLKKQSEEVPFCPNCDAPEVNKEFDVLYVRGWKVHDGEQNWSHCMKCHVWFGEDNTVDECKSDCYCYDIYDKDGTYLKGGE